MNSKISIITVTYNCESLIKKTIESIICQSYPNVEFIVVDGRSTDKTLSVIENYKNKITKIISEKDNGIYDAMNKGISLASGEWIIFMNSGDYFISSTVIEDCFTGISEQNYDIIYGSIQLSTMGCVYNLKPAPLDSIKYQMPFCHQAIFARTELLKRQPFDTTFKILADYYMFRKLYEKKCRFKYVDKIIACYSPDGGFSRKKEFLKEKEMCRILNLTGVKKFLKLTLTYLRLMFIRNMPYSLLSKIRKYKYRNNPNFSSISN